MHNLTVVGVEAGALVAADADGARFRIAIDEDTQSLLRDAHIDAAANRRLAPREIQSHVRAGMSAEQVAALTGASVDYIRRFEGPVLAEREYMVESALGVVVQSSPDDPALPKSTFGLVIAARLATLGARGQRFASWKEQENGWIIKLSFTADEIDHDARWKFEPKKQLLTPLNSEAVTLSQLGEMSEGLIPRLRAVQPQDFETADSTFDSAVFTLDDLPEPIDGFGFGDGSEPSRRADAPSDPDGSISVDSVGAARNRSQLRAATGPVAGRESLRPQAADTADLLESLRRRRGEREAAAFDEDSSDDAASETGSSLRVLNKLGSARRERRGNSGEADQPRSGDADPAASERVRPTLVRGGKAETAAPELPGAGKLPQDGDPSAPSGPTAHAAGATAAGKGRRGRATMPSWDEIVFGARPLDDPA